MLYGSMIFAMAMAQVVSASTMIKEQPFRIPQDLFYAASAASGYWHCDRRVGASQGRIFDSRYGDRVIALAKLIEEKDGLGWGPEDIIVASCGRPNEQSRARAMRKFGQELAALERKYMKP